MMTEKMERKGNNLKPEGRGKPDIRMIALDLDGTALDRKMRVTERTVRAMEEAARRGVQVVISTGRTYHTLPEQLRKIRGLDYAVTSNGAIINRLKTGEVLYRNCLPREAVEQAAEIFRREGVGAGADGTDMNSGSGGQISIEIFTEGDAFMERRELEDIAENGSSYRNAFYVSTTRRPADGIVDFMLAHRQRIENICLNFPDISRRPVWRERLSRLPGVTLTTSLPHNMEIGGKNTSKGEALRFLMKELGLSAKQLMACGDSPNDASMIRLAGLGVVMGNSSEEMKEKADFVTDSNESDGVAKAIERFVLV